MNQTPRIKKSVFNLLITLIILLPGALTYTQTNMPYKIMEIDLVDSLQIVDSNYIIPESVKIIGENINLVQITIYQKEIHVKNLSPKPNHIKILYTVLSSSPDLVITMSDTTAYQIIHEVIPMSNKFHPKENTSGKITSNELDYAGAFGRGLSFGNNQNLVLNSTLDVQLSGKLGDDIEINAAITDQTLPIQADGNTAQLNEIDKVYIELKKKNQKILAGDQQLQPDETYFLKYRKKYKGILFSSFDSLKNGSILKTSFGGAIARGNFKRQSLSILEGNQGPYRLTGNANDLFIIVLSASEKVYLDGSLLQRGLENDYVMDYNIAEISFTAKHLINRNSRVVVEFEYSNQSYLKSAWSLQSKYQSKNLSIQWNSYQENDNKSSNILQTLTDNDIHTLQAAGDHTALLNKSTIRSIDPTVESNIINYRLIDTTVQGVRYKNILLLDQQRNSNAYAAQFNFIGPHGGNYSIENNLFTNGRAYRWTAPDPITHQPTGEYEPITSLQAPKRQSQHSLKINYAPLSGVYSSSEISLSNLNLNLYSTKDQSDNLGLALKQIIGTNKKIKNAQWNNELIIEKQSKTFSFFEPFRNPEFNRDWNIEINTNDPKGDILTSLRTDLIHSDYELGYQLKHYSNNQAFTGTYHGWNADFHQKGTNLKLYGSAMTNDSKEYSGQFIRPNFDLIQNLKKNGTQVIGIALANESNTQRKKTDQALYPTSFSFKSIKAFYKGVIPALKLDYHLEYTHRTDDQIEIDHFTKHFYAEDFTLEQHWQINKNSNWSFRLGDRKLKYNSLKNPLIEKNSHTLILRQSFNTKSSNNVFRFYETIESNSGQEPAIEYTYIKVNKGQGYYTWIDANKDSIIQVTEFELAPFSDLGEYIRYAVTGNNFVKTRNYLFLQNFEFDGSKIKREGKPNWIQRIGFNSNINYNWKVTDSNSSFLPIQIQNPGIIAVQGLFRNQIYFNRGDPRIEIQSGSNSSTNKWRLSTGFETRTSTEIYIRSRQKINNSLSFENYIAHIFQKNVAELFKDKNYSIQNNIIEPKINFQSNNSFRISTSYRYKSGYESNFKTKSTTHEAKVECMALSKAPWSFRGSFSSIWASLTGKQNPLTEYSMLQGWRAGYNALIQFSVDRQINVNTILRLGYDGRKSEGSRYIQTGRAQIVASF